MDELREPDTPSTAGRRARSRLRLSVPARIETTFDRFEAVLLDISLTGARIAVTDELAPGRDLVLSWSSHEAFGQVVWANGATCGLRFYRPLAPAALIATRDVHDGRIPDPDGAIARRFARDWVEGRI